MNISVSCAHAVTIRDDLQKVWLTDQWISTYHRVLSSIISRPQPGGICRALSVHVYLDLLMEWFPSVSQHRNLSLLFWQHGFSAFSSVMCKMRLSLEYLLVFIQRVSSSDMSKLMAFFSFFFLKWELPFSIKLQGIYSYVWLVLVY